MPVYIYKCKNCHKMIEVFQKSNDPPIKKCQECHGPMVKIIAPVGIIFKGPGFYATDYKVTSESKKEEKKDAPEKKEKEKSFSAQKESKDLDG